MIRSNVPQTVLVLDSGATIHFFSSENMMKNIHDGPEPLRIHFGGKAWNQYAIGELCDNLNHLPLSQRLMYIAKDGIGNLHSLGHLAKHYRITLDTNIENAFYVYKEDGSYIKFECRNNGLYCLDIADGPDHTNLLTTVKDQKELFSDIDVKRATLARYIQECLCLPSDKDFSHGLETGGIKECGVDRRHINIANEIYGPSKHAVEGKSVQRTNRMPRENTTTSLPPSILRRYGDVTIGECFIKYHSPAHLGLCRNNFSLTGTKKEDWTQPSRVEIEFNS